MSDTYKGLKAAATIYVAPSLGPDVNEIAKVLCSNRSLKVLVTRTAFGRRMHALLRRAGLITISRRSAAPVERRLIRAVPSADVVFAARRAFGDNLVSATDAAFDRVDRSAAALMDASVTVVVGREDACVRTFQAAKRVGARCIYQLPTAYYKYVKPLLEDEAALFPTAAVQNLDVEYSAQRCARKDAELALADYVLCPSEFVRHSVAFHSPESNATSIPLAIDAERWYPVTRKEPVFLYVGNISLRKGVHRLLSCWKKLRAYRTHRLRLIGDMQLRPQFLAEYKGMYDWIPRIHRVALLEHYGSAQAFVFNALADGFGHVFGEAMACGTAVLCSRSSGAPDLVTDGIEGTLFDYGDDDQLSGKLDWALTHPKEVAEMGKRARERALSHTWTEFGRVLLDWLATVGTEEGPDIEALEGGGGARSSSSDSV